MNITEYAENLFNLAYSQEMIDFITNLGDTSSDEWRMKVTAIREYYFFVFYKNTSQFFIVGYMRRGNNTTDFVYINLNNAFILSQHLLSRFRKRVVADGMKYDLRGRMFDIYWNIPYRHLLISMKKCIYVTLAYQINITIIILLGLNSD